MSVDSVEPSEWKTNAKGGQDCCDEIYPDDGRVTFSDSKGHKGDWGRHRKEKDLDGVSYVKSETKEAD